MFTILKTLVISLALLVTISNGVPEDELEFIKNLNEFYTDDAVIIDGKTYFFIDF